MSVGKSNVHTFHQTTRPHVGKLDLISYCHKHNMSDNSLISLWCAVIGHPKSLIEVKISPSESISIMKELIYERLKTSLLKDVDAVQLALWKVRRLNMRCSL